MSQQGVVRQAELGMGLRGDLEALWVQAIIGAQGGAERTFLLSIAVQPWLRSFGCSRPVKRVKKGQCPRPQQHRKPWLPPRTHRQERAEPSSRVLSQTNGLGRNSVWVAARAFRGPTTLPRTSLRGGTGQRRAFRQRGQLQTIPCGGIPVPHATGRLAVASTNQCEQYSCML